MEEELEMSAKTAIRRKEPSLPVKILEENKLLHGKILDYGCGFGKDVEYLKGKGFDVEGYDPYYAPNYHLLTDETYDIVLCIYVLNTVYPKTREKILSEIYRILKPNGVAYIAVRDTSERVEGVPFKDGVLTSRGTFQKLFSPEELVALLSRFFDHIELINRRQPLLAKASKLSIDKLKEKFKSLLKSKLR